MECMIEVYAIGSKSENGVGSGIPHFIDTPDFPTEV